MNFIFKIEVNLILIFVKSLNYIFIYFVLTNIYPHIECYLAGSADQKTSYVFYIKQNALTNYTIIFYVETNHF